jgi:hypothetical protein
LSRLRDLPGVRTASIGHLRRALSKARTTH